METEDQILMYIQDRLSKEDRQAFEARMASDRSLAAEVAVVKSARAEFASMRASGADVQAGWADLERRIEADQVAVPPAANVNGPIRLGLLQVAAVAALAVMVWQFVAVPQMGNGPDMFETVSEQGDGFVLQVVFQPDATLADTTEFLSRFQGTISDGPGATGVYRLRFEGPELLESALTAASENRALFQFVAAE